MSDVLTLKQLADHLQLSERTVYRLLGRGQLPGFKIGGHWRFRRSVVDYWLDLRMGRMSSAEIHEMEQEWRLGPFSISDALAEDNGLVRPSGQSRRDIINSFVNGITFPDPVNAEHVMSRIWEREQVASTAAEGGVAFLHTARWDARAMHRADLVAIGRLSTPVDFGALDGKPTDILVLLLAADSRQHLILLAKAVQLCRHPGFLAGVRHATTAAGVVTLVRDAERAMAARVSPAIPS